MAVRPLAKLLTDMMVSPLTAEALARIGGVQAYRALGKHWLQFADTLDAEPLLGLLAHVLEGLPRAAPQLQGLRESLLESLRSQDETASTSAARALLALGPPKSEARNKEADAVAEQDEAALAALARSQVDPSILPSCLVRRKDLIAYLCQQQGALTSWGLLLVARYPKDTPIEVVVETLATVAPLEHLDSILKALARLRDPETAGAILDLYLRIPVEYRSALTPIFPARRAQLRSVLDERTEPGAAKPIDRPSRLVLQAVLGTPARSLVAAIEKTSEEKRAAIISQITERRDVLAELPWQTWLEARPDLYGKVAAEVAIASDLRDLLPLLRRLLRESPSPTLVRAVGELGDSESVDILIELLQLPRSEMDAMVLESLGRGGGARARAALREAARSKESGRARMAYRALSLCATKDDDTFFRQAVSHGDWFVRLSCAEVLGRFSRPENMAALAQLAADPVPIVSQRALSFLEA